MQQNQHHYLDEFEYVKRTFFPRWDRKMGWCFQLVDDLDGALGKCNTDSKAIQLTAAPIEGLREILIHEIAHAVSAGRHGKKWQVRMEMAAKRAVSLQMEKLAAQLRKDVEAYQDPTKSYYITAALVYTQIRDSVTLCPEATFENVIDWVRLQNGMSEQAFLARFKRARRVYDRAQKDM
ncbi:MAG: SprT-like domain-containing protein [Desulfomonilaceae bacterium]